MIKKLTLFATFVFLGGFFMVNSAKAATQGDVIINEFSSASNTEWVELLNTTGSPVDLTGWTIQDSAQASKSLSSLGTIPAHGIVVFQQASGWLNNAPTTETITIFDNTSVPIYSVSYGSAPSLNITAPSSIQSAFFNGTSWSITSTSTKGWFNDAQNYTCEQMSSGTPPAYPPTLSSLATCLAADPSYVATNMGSLSNPSAATDLYFEKSISSSPVGRITFAGPLNLTDQNTVNYLKAIGAKMEASKPNGGVKVGLNTSDTSSFSGISGTVKMYGVTGDTAPSLIVRNNAGDIITSGGDYPTITPGTFNGAADTYEFTTSHFTSFETEKKVINTTTGVGYDTIQAAIDAASSGNTINVAAGDYAENLTINKSLSLTGVGDTTIINGGVDSNGANVTIQDLKITNQNSKYNSGTFYYGVKATAGKALTLENVTIDVLYYGVFMLNGSSVSGTAITLNNSRIKGYAAIYLNGAGATDAVVDVFNTSLLGRIKSSGSSDDFAVIPVKNTSGVHINFTGTSSVANEFTNGAQAKEHLMLFVNANDVAVTGTPTYTNAANSTVSAGAEFWSYPAPYTNTVEGQIVARYVTNTTEFEAALASDATTPIVVGRYETAINTTAGTKTLNAGVTLIIEDHTPVTISGGTTLVNNGTILIESGATFTKIGTISGSGTINLCVNIGGTVGCFSSIQTAITAAPSGAIINVGAGIYKEQLNITKGVTLVGDVTNPDNVVIDGEDKINLPNPGQVRIYNPTGPVIFKGFKIINGGTISVGGGYYAILTKGNYSNTISYNKIYGTNDASKTEDYGFWAYTGQEGLVFSHNTITQTGGNAVLIENHAGAVEISNNTLDEGVSGSTAVFVMNYDGVNVTTLQKITGNTINVGTGNFTEPWDGTWTSGGITFSSAIGTSTGTFTNINITDNIITSLLAHRRGISLKNNSSNGTAGEISNFTITGNTVTGTGATDSIGIRLVGLVSGGNIQNNKLSNLEKGLTSSTSTVVAENNWWGSADPDFGTIISGSVSYNPWYLNPSMSVLSNAISDNGTVDSTTENFDLVASESGQTGLPTGVTDVILSDTTKLDLNSAVASQSGSFTGGNLTGENLSIPQMIGDISVTVGESVNLQSGTDGQPIVLTNDDLSNVSLEIPDNTTVLAPAAWDGTIAPPTTGSDSGTAPSGFSVGDTVIEVGSSTGVLLFDKPVSIILTGVTGAVAYRPSGSTVWVQITTICGGTYDSPAAPEFPGECAITLGGNTKIFTYHLTSFGGLDVVPPSNTGGGSYGQYAYQPPVTPTPIPTATPTPEVLGEAIVRGNSANLTNNGLKEGDTVSAGGSSDLDVYIVNQFGYKRLFLNPIIFNMYGHLKAGWSKVKNIISSARDLFPTSVLFRNCETNDLKVYALETTGEDTATLHWVNLTGDQAVAQDAEFFKKVFCINSNEFNWYSKSSTDFSALSQVPVYSRK